MTAEEQKSLQNAMKKQEFRSLLDDYMREISDPKSKAEYEQYLDQLEREGNLQQTLPPGMQLMRPTPGFCIKCLVTGNSGGRWDNPDKSYPASVSKPKPVAAPTNPKELKKLFINICHSALIERAAPVPKSKAANRTPGGGDNWHIPFLLSPSRYDRDNST